MPALCKGSRLLIFLWTLQNTVKGHVFQDANCVLLELWSRSEWRDYPMDSVFQVSLSCGSQKDLPMWCVILSSEGCVARGFPQAEGVFSGVLSVQASCIPTRTSELGCHQHRCCIWQHVSQRPGKLWFQGPWRLLACGDMVFLWIGDQKGRGWFLYKQTQEEDCLSLWQEESGLIIPYLSHFSAQRTNQVLLWAAAHPAAVYKGEKEWCGFCPRGHSWLREVCPGENPSSHHGPGMQLSSPWILSS